ncbi:hypothetical protein [Sutcliffiella deserti]|uniref:hypothetical protein n=1 Tax=Sutcliffiella deserti TaxID=2875501 RepID=UPI001CBEEE84|nr:hypothetical protein [Sutcliffiella deserti]
MGLVMKGLEALTSKEIYTLLLNIDFIPYMGEQNYSEPIEFFFHLLIAIFIGVMFGWILNYFKVVSKWRKYMLSLLITLPTVFLYFPLTILAVKATPPVSDVQSFTLWTICHLLFAILLPAFYTFFHTRKEDNSI